jgi:2-polyprenyl-6-methoxyphenol hydroxylase-like FAD-dependent oxidoreductase
MTYVSATGKHLASMNAAFGVVDAADVEIVRGDLVGTLYESARSGAEYIFGDSVAGMAEVSGAVEVTFERAEPRTFDLVIGADRLHSTLRALAFGPESSFVRHLDMYLSVFTVRNDVGLDHWQLIHVSLGKSVTVTGARDNT